MNVDGDTPRATKFSLKEYVLLASFILDESKCTRLATHNNTHAYMIYTQKEKPNIKITVSTSDLVRLPWYEFSEYPEPAWYILVNRPAVRMWLSTLDPTLLLEHLL